MTPTALQDLSIDSLLAEGEAMRINMNGFFVMAPLLLLEKFGVGSRIPHHDSTLQERAQGHYEVMLFPNSPYASSFSKEEASRVVEGYDRLCSLGTQLEIFGGEPSVTLDEEARAFVRARVGEMQELYPSVLRGLEFCFGKNLEIFDLTNRRLPEAEALSRNGYLGLGKGKPEANQ